MSHGLTVRDLSGSHALSVSEKSISTETASGSVATFETDLEREIPSLVVAIEPVQAGSGDPSPDNVRPITGWEGVDIWDDPIYTKAIKWNQLFDVENPKTLDDRYVTYDSVNHEYTITYPDGSALASTVLAFSYPMISGHVYIMGAGLKEQSDEFNMRIMIGTSTTGLYINTHEGLFRDGEVRSQTADGTGTFRISKPAATTYAQSMVCSPFCYDITEVFGEEFAEQIRQMDASSYGSGVALFREYFPLQYYPYNQGELTCVSAVNGDPYRHVNITFPTEVGTIYGGVLDTSAGTLTVNTVKYTSKGTGTQASGNKFAKGASTNYHVYYTLSTASSPLKSTQTAVESYPTVKCSHFPLGSQVTPYTYCVGSKQLRICLPLSDERNTADLFNAWVAEQYEAGTPLEMTALLEEPIVYHLEPVTISTLLGQNNIWADVGDITVTYQQLIDSIAHRLNVREVGA